MVWAQENSRDAIFAALRRKETYGTSGTRPVVRFFGGYDFEPGLCESGDLVGHGYALGVPMGGRIGPDPAGSAPGFIVSALKDPGVSGREGNDLQRIQIIKGWLDESGNTHEQAFDVVGDNNNDAWVDTQTCQPIGSGAKGDVYGNCCKKTQEESFYSPVIQERAWTSPIWYEPQ